MPTFITGKLITTTFLKPNTATVADVSIKVEKKNKDKYRDKHDVLRLKLNKP